MPQEEGTTHLLHRVVELQRQLLRLLLHVRVLLLLVLLLVLDELVAQAVAHGLLAHCDLFADLVRNRRVGQHNGRSGHSRGIRLQCQRRAVLGRIDECTTIP